MQSVDTHTQAFNGQQRQQRHAEDPPTNHLSAMPAGTFLLPSDQGQFTFSAEPDSMLHYAPLTTTNGQEPAFTTSSFDSSLHPDMISQTFPPANAQMQLQNYGLSPASHGRNGYSLSPSHSMDHLSPETGYLSDSSYNINSNYATPAFNGQFIDDFSSQLNFSENPATFHQYTGEPVDMSMLTGNSLATFNAQPPTLPSNAQLVSPSPTANSSPIVREDMPRNNQRSGMQYVGSEYHPSSTPPNRASHVQQSTPSKHQQQQHSPALTNSPSNRSLANPQARAHLTSPIVRVENYGGRESPSLSDTSRPMSKRSHGSRRSGNHLSPYPHDGSSDDDDDSHQPVRVQPVVRSTERNEDGSWVSGQAGLNPEDRKAVNDAWVPSLEEIADQRFKDEKKLEVQDWLSKSEVGSEAEDTNSSANLLKPFTTRRRAKSTNDAFRQGFNNGYGLGVHTDLDHVDDSNVPGPGIYINEGSEYDDYEEDEYEGEMEPESPPADVDISASRADNEVSAFPTLDGGLLGAVVRPWVDAASQPAPSSTRYQPPTSNAAMMRFRRRAKDVESASLAATVGSRRLSESDLGSIRAAPGVVKVVEPDIKKQKDRQRRPSFLENMLTKRAPTNLLKRKGSIPVPPATETAVDRAKEATPEKPKRIGSWGRPKSPKVDTNVAHQGRDLGPPSSTGLSATNNKWYQGITRVRSKSDLGKAAGLAELMTRHGGPPMPMLASPLADTEATKASSNPSPAGDDDDDEAQEAVTMDLTVRSDPIIPTYEGFRTHARQLNPRLTEYMVERITQEQMRRYKRLLEFRVKHLNAVKNRNCPSGKFCPELGGESQQLAPRAGNKDADAPFIGFQVTAPEASGDDGEPLPEGTVVPAQFPSGVPLPPVKRLPAEFECPLCFRVKQFYKPSDWTKHVHEDVQPFTCTFPNCGEPKSFKRKADWVRHENERHRQLEHWTCQIADCNHTCYRKDNFVQHLVREHKIAEPRQRTAKGANKDASPNADSDDIWGLVARCRGDTTKQPKDEPCRFCGNICTSWKKLTVHLAKHMEQISMPILPLVEQKQMNADTIISPVVELGDKGKLSGTPNRSPIDNPSRYIPPNPATLAPGIDPSSFTQYAPDTPSGASPNTMHTYPPPQMPPQTSSYTAFATENPQGFTRTYPGLDPTKPKGAYMNNLQIPNQLYMNGNMPNGPNRFPITPVSAIQQQQQGMFTDSPVDATPYSTDTLGSTYFPQEQQQLASNGLDMGFNAGNSAQFQQPTAYQTMAFLKAQQQNYQYQRRS